MSTERTGGISIVVAGEMFKGDGVGKVELWRDRVFVGNQRLAGLATGERVVHSEVAMLDGRVAGDKEREVRVVVDVRKGDVMLFIKRVCKWEWG